MLFLLIPVVCRMQCEFKTEQNIYFNVIRQMRKKCMTLYEIVQLVNQIDFRIAFTPNGKEDQKDFYWKVELQSLPTNGRYTK